MQKQIVRVEFRLPFRPKPGIPVMNQLAEEIGVIVEVVDKAGQDEAGNFYYTVRADVTEPGAAFQVFEQPYMATSEVPR